MKKCWLILILCAGVFFGCRSLGIRGLGVSQHNDDCSNPVVKVDYNKYNSFHISLLGRG